MPKLEQAHARIKNRSRKPAAKSAPDVEKKAASHSADLGRISRQAKAEPGSLSASDLLHLQRISGNQYVARLLGTLIRPSQPIQRKASATGLPENLKAGVENLSGLAMDDVRVHYNSSEPAGMQALAYTEGTDIHVASGQEQHLAHEAWHVVQQKQGKVTPSVQVKGIYLNDDSSLENEADTMGAQASRQAVTERLPGPAQVNHSLQQFGMSAQPVQQHLSGTRVRQNKCGPKKKTKQPDLQPIPEPREKTLQELANEHNVNDQDLQDAANWLQVSPAVLLDMKWPEFVAAAQLADPAADAVVAFAVRVVIATIYPDYGRLANEVQDRSEKGKVKRDQALSAIVPPQIISGLDGLDEAHKVDAIFENFNRFGFNYTGDHQEPVSGFLTKTGDCETLRDMFNLAIEAAGIVGVDQAQDRVPRLVQGAPIHGRTTTGNDLSGNFWFFVNHYWSTYHGTPYDLLFAKKGGAIPPHFSFESNGAYEGVPYLIFAGSHYFIESRILSSKLAINTDKLGIAFSSLSELKNYITIHKIQQK